MFDTIIQRRLRQGKILKIYLEGEGQDTTLIIEAFPGGEIIDIPDAQEPIQPTPELEPINLPPAVPEEPVI